MNIKVLTFLILCSVLLGSCTSGGYYKHSYLERSCVQAEARYNLRSIFFRDRDVERVVVRYVRPLEYYKEKSTLYLVCKAEYIIHYRTIPKILKPYFKFYIKKNLKTNKDTLINSIRV